MNGRPLDAVVIGAGPYALAAAAHLRESGADIRVFGRPMSFWREHMPRGMRIRSRWNASHIAHPRNDLSLDAYETARGRPIERPMPLADFIAYAGWFQQHVAPDVDARDVARVHARSDGFRVVLADGESIDCRRVVVAAGISAFAWRPPEFADLPRELASHSSDHSELGVFAAKRVVVIGGGQSAIESAALLHEAGADVEVIMRRPVLRWVGRATREGLLGRVFFHRTDVGPALVSHVVARPPLLRLLPEGLQQEVMRRSLAPGASIWLRPRVGEVRMTNGRYVASAARTNGHLSLRLDDGSTREIDHALLATGFRIDVRRYAFLDPAVLGEIRCLDGYPVLGPGLESSVPGLHFLGAPAARTFGPLLRFVSGTQFATRSLVRGVTRRAAVTSELDGDASFESALRERRST